MQTISRDCCIWLRKSRLAQNIKARTVFALLVSLPLFGSVEPTLVQASEKGILNEYQITCLKFGLDFSGLKGAFVASDWKDVTSNPPTEIVNTLRISEQAAKQMPEGSGIDSIVVLEKKLPDRALIAIASASHIQSKKIVGCQLYDVAGTRNEFPLVFPDVVKDQNPDRRENQQGITLTWKNPSGLPDIIVVRMGFIAPDTSIAKQIGISGIMMMTTAMSKE